MKKRFKKQKDLIKQAVNNTLQWTDEEKLCRNVFRLNGMKTPKRSFIRYIIKEQKKQEVDYYNEKYKELTK